MNFEGTPIENATVQIRRKNESAWLTLGSPANLNPWTAKIAGIFEMRGIGTVDGKSVETPVAEVEVRFPAYSEITGDPTVSNAMESAWTQTTNDCKAIPNERHELGFWIQLNTVNSSYIVDPLLQGDYVGPSQNAYLTVYPRPADSSTNPQPTELGATYTVGLFHTHTPRTYLSNTNLFRYVGPSGNDVSIMNTEQVVGILFDYIGVPTFTSTRNCLFNGHSLSAPRQLYPISPNRRPTQ